MTDRSKTRVFQLIELNKVRNLADGSVYTVDDFVGTSPETINLLNTRAAIGHTTKTDGVLEVVLTGTNDDLLTPPDSP